MQIVSSGAFADVVCPSVKNEVQIAPQDVYLVFGDEDDNGSVWFSLILASSHAGKPLQRLALVRGPLDDFVFHAELSVRSETGDIAHSSFLLESWESSRDYSLVATYADRVTPCLDTESYLFRLSLPTSEEEELGDLTVR